MMDRRERLGGICKRGMRVNRLLYHVWYNMRDRCHNPRNAHSIKDYAGRGIGVCLEWSEFPSFLSWAMESGYKRGLTIERIDNDGNYEPLNCRWATAREQGMNKRNNIFVMYRGESRRLSELAALHGLKTRSVWHRIFKNKWSVESAISVPFSPSNKKLKLKVIG